MSLERELRSLELPWPETPDVVATIADRLDRRGPASRRSTVLGSPWLRPALVVVLALAVAAAAVPSVRAEIKRLLGFAGGERIERVERVPAASRRLDLGTSTTLANARRAARFAVAVPRRLGMPDEVRVGGDLGARAVTLLYGADTALTEIPAASAIGAIKQIGGRVELRAVDIANRTGYWIAPGSRGLILPGPPGTRGVTRRTAIPGASVLLWDRDGVAYRLETRRPFREAVAIARSVPVA